MVNRGPILMMLACAVVLTLPAQAEDNANVEATMQGPLTVGHLDAIMQEEILYKAQVARAKQEAELAKYEGTRSKTQTVDAFALPNVAWRRATVNGWLAKFVFQDGTSLIAGRGQPLPGGIEVAQINESGIQLKHNGRLIDLSAARPSPSVQEPNIPNTSLGPHPEVLATGLPSPM